MMWGSWLSWVLIGGLILFMFRRGGCGGHAGHGGSAGNEEGRDAARKPDHGGCH